MSSKKIIVSSGGEKLWGPLFVIAEEVPPIQSARIAAALVDTEGRVFIGTNKKKSHPLQDKFKDRPSRLFVHAEIAAIVKARQWYQKRRLTLPSFDLYMVRVIKQTKTEYVSALVTPCDGCFAALEYFGCRKVVTLKPGVKRDAV